MSASPLPYRFEAGSVWPGFDEHGLFKIMLTRKGMNEGFSTCDHQERRGRRRERAMGNILAFGCGYHHYAASLGDASAPPCTFRILLEPVTEKNIARTRVTQACTTHNHPLNLSSQFADYFEKQDAKYIADLERDVRKAALEHLHDLRHKLNYRLTSHDVPMQWEIDLAFARQKQVPEDVKRCLGSAQFCSIMAEARTKKDLLTSRDRESATETIRALEAREAQLELAARSRISPVTPRHESAPSPERRQERKEAVAEAKAMQEKDKQQQGTPKTSVTAALPTPSTSGTAEGARPKRKIAVLDLSRDSDEEDVKPRIKRFSTPTPAPAPAPGPLAKPELASLEGYLRSLSSPFPFHQYLHLFMRPSIAIDSPEQLAFVAASPDDLNLLLEELGKTRTLEEGAVEPGMPSIWLLGLRRALTDRVAGGTQ